MIDYILWTVSGIFVGIILHAVSIISFPHLLPQEIWEKVESLVSEDSIVLLDSESETNTNLPMLDPTMEHSICRFSLADAPRIIQGEMGGFYWSIAIFNTNSEVVFSTNNRIMRTDSVALIVGTKQQLPQTIQSSVEEFSSVKVVQVPDDEVFVLFRAFRPDLTMKEEVQGFLSGLSCGPLDTTS